VAELARGRWDVTGTYATNPGDLDQIEWRQLDVRDADAVSALVAESSPAVIVHTAALNPGQGNDFEAVNVTGTANVANAAAAADARLIHMSTDMVFDGQRGDYREDDPVGPINDYGRSKAAAEAAVRESGAQAVIVRTSLIYGWRPTVARAAQWMIDALDRREFVRLWSDEMRCPIWVESLASAVVELAGLDYTGPLHVAGDEKISRYEFGLALLRFHHIDRGPVFAVEVPRDQLRPRDCTLDTSRARGLLETPLPGVTRVLSS
jgi:dTDP-4-dehydrorhamnose reductase